MSGRARTTLIHCASFLALAIACQPALAQDQPPPPQGDAAPQQQDEAEPVEEGTIIVTGSRIARAGFDTVQPAMVVSAEQIDQRGYTNIGQALSELPAFGVPGNSNVGAQAGSFGAGQTFADFFSLGSQRTLTLVNGRRFVSSNTSSIFGPVDSGGQVDLNVIPETLVQRIETVAIGGAPIYGSDAIAGTVNIITKRDFDGLELRAQTGTSERGDAAEYRINGLWGMNFAENRGNITVSAEWNKGRGLPTSARPRITGGSGPFFTTASDPDSSFLQQLFFGRRINVVARSGIPLAGDFIPEFSGIFDAQGNALMFNDAGRLIPIDFGNRTGSLIESEGGNTFAIQDHENLITNTERYLGNVLASYKITDNIRWFGEAWYSHSKGTNIATQPVYNTFLFGPAGSSDGQLILNVDNPFLHPDDRAIIADNLAAIGGLDEDGDGVGDGDLTRFLMARANVDIANGRAATTVELYRFVTGFDGTFDIGERTYNWEASVNYGHSETKGRERVLVQQNFLNALDAVTDASGNIICRPGYVNANIPTFSSTCAPLNLFGLNRYSQEAFDYITANANPTAVNQQLVFNANANGPLFKLPGGDVVISLGYEHREEKTNFDPGAFYFGELQPDGSRTQFGRSIPIDPVKGKFDTDEVFGELRIPIISSEMDSFVHSLEFEGAVRYIDHSLAGGDWTWTAGGRFAPIEDITLRGNFTRSVRAPAITEIFNPTSQAFDTANDPCDARFVNAGPNPATRRANCIAAGIVDPDNFTSNIVDFTSQISVSGNPDLTNEKADSWTVGAVLRPRFVPGLTVAVDWVDISVKNAIVSLNTEQTLEACYDAVSFPIAVCDQIDRDFGPQPPGTDPGQITFVRTGFANAASLDFEGLTAEIAYRRQVATETTLGLSLNYLYVNKLETRVGSGDIDTGRGEIGDPKHSFTFNINVDHGPLNALWQTQYFGKSVWDADAAPNDFEINGVGDWWLFNASVGYEVNDNLEVRLVVDNVFDADPPYPAPAGGGTITYFSGVLGRYFRASAKIKF